MMKKIRERKGFTLAELLIVVAIIAVLVAIAIPVFTAQLEKAKIATDKANVRSWYAEEVASYLSDSDKYTAKTAYDGTTLQAAGAAVTFKGSLAGGDWVVTYANDAGDGMELPAK